MTQKTENLLPFKKTSGNQKCFKTIFKNSRDVFFFLVKSIPNNLKISELFSIFCSFQPEALATKLKISRQ